ncbi:hypothetical protein [Variovorax sp. UC74_104]|uniref:hypothetical protein n=1 Tax=Variovorax sp. UC74_104 TaxID=3374555 RepID=UPI0037563D88
MLRSPVEVAPVPPSVGMVNTICPPAEPMAAPLASAKVVPAGAFAGMLTDTSVGGASPFGPGSGSVSTMRTSSAVEALLFDTVMV